MSGIKKDKLGKHVSRACLACRSRHLKCDGHEPICKRCQKSGRLCQYVKSNRGGSRKKGVSMKKQRSPEAAKAASSRELDDFVLPCVRNGVPHLKNQPGCHQQCLDPQNYGKLPDCMTGGVASASSVRSSSGSAAMDRDEDSNIEIDMNPTFDSSSKGDALTKVYDPVLKRESLEQCYISPALIKDLDVESIINTYYNFFHSDHPFLPLREDMLTYLDSIPYNYDLLLAMKIMGDGQATTIYSRDIETVNFLVTSILNYIRQVGPDFIALQSLLIICMISHISSLHDYSMLLREALVSQALELKLTLLDQNTVPDTFMDVNGFITERSDANNNFSSASSSKQTRRMSGTHVNNKNYVVNMMNTPSESDSKDDVLSEIMMARRCSNIPKRILEDTVRRTLWEIYFFDTISGTASGQTMSLLSSRKIVVLYPSTVSPTEFDYKSRAESCKLVNDSIKLNVAIQADEDVNSHLVHMEAAIGNWEMKLENPDLYNSPYLLNANGRVNEGVFEAIMLVNYAKIFTHRPFSYLWRPDVSKHPKCTDEEGIADNCPPLKKQDVDSRKIIETRKTIDSASSVVKALLDTDPAKVTKRTPFLACALAFSCLVHLSAYSWVESSLQVLRETGDSVASLRENINEEELETYTEYIKLEVGAIYQISRHWELSAKLIQHIKETLKRVSPKLYKKVQSGIPESRPSPIQIDAGSGRYLTKETANVSSTSMSGRPAAAKRSVSTATPTLSSSSTQPTDSKTPTNNSDLIDILRSNDVATAVGIDEKQIPSAAGVGAMNPPATVPTDFNDADFNIMMEDDYLGLSPSSDTGCDWVDKHIFEFDGYNIDAPAAVQPGTQGK